MRKNSPQPLLSIQDAANRAGVSVLTIRRRIADGTIPAQRLGKRLIRISVDDLDAAFTVIPTTKVG